MEKNSKIYIAGNTGMVGSAILRNLESKGYSNFVFTPWPKYDLTNQAQTLAFFEKEKPEYVFLAAAKVGGIAANNTYRAQFLYENLMIQNNIIHSAYKYRVKKLLFLGSSCIYPKEAPQPLKEEYLLTGPLEYTNEPYAIAKIAGIKMCESYYRQYGCNFISVMPTNLYGLNDSYDLNNSHVLPALIRKFYLSKCLEQNNWDAIRRDLDKNQINGVDGSHPTTGILNLFLNHGIKKQDSQVTITLWGSGDIFREFLHVDDMADACTHIIKQVEATKLYDYLKLTHINIGTGIDITINDLAELVRKIVGFKGGINWDKSKSDGTHKKQLDVGLLTILNWNYKIELQKGVKEVYINYIK